jgi:hypothetical protein
LNGLIELQLPYSDGLLRRYGLIPKKKDAPAVMRIMQRVVRHPSVAKKRAKLISLATILQQMNPQQLAALRKSAVR